MADSAPEKPALDYRCAAIRQKNARIAKLAANKLNTLSKMTSKNRDRQQNSARCRWQGRKAAQTGTVIASIHW